MSKAGIVSFSRLKRVFCDALPLLPNIPDHQNKMNLDDQELVAFAIVNASLILPESQSLITASSLVYPESKRKQAIRDALTLKLYDGDNDFQHIVESA